MLIYPPFTQPITSKKRCLFPLGIAYIASYLRNHGIDVELLDAMVEGYDNEIVEGNKKTFGLSRDGIRIRIERYNPDFVGVSCLMTEQRKNALDVCKIAKRIDPEIHTIMGGCHPSVFPQETLSHEEVDSVVIGEGEHATLDIVKDNIKGIVKRDILDIDKIPWPARDLLPMGQYVKINMPTNIFSPYNRVTQILTSRGCPFKCIFCATTSFHGKWRGRSAEDVLKEAKFLKEEYSIEELDIIDENFVLDRERTIKILEGFAKLDIAWSNAGGIWVGGLDEELIDSMKKSGCYQLTLPIESSNPRILKEVIHKPLKLDAVKPLVQHCKKLGIDTHAFFVCGFPQETKEDIINDYNFAMAVGFESATFNIITPLPGSELYEQYKDQLDIDKINYTTVSIKHPTIPDKELEEMIRDFNIKFNRSLLWKSPKKFVKKYIGTSLRKFSLKDLPKLFMRQ